MGGMAMGGKRLSFEEGTEMAGNVIKYLSLNDVVSKAEVAGSLRRKKAAVGDIDLVVIGGDKLNAILGEMWGWCKPRRKGDAPKAKKSGLWNDVQVDVNVADAEGWGAMMMFATGSAETNIIQRKKAKELGMLLNEKGLWRDGVRIAGETEIGIYEVLGMEWIEPENRNGYVERRVSVLV